MRPLIAAAFVAANALSSVASGAEAPVLVAPRLVDAPEVIYPEGAAGDAVVVLELVIDETGAVSSAAVLEGEEPFAARAVEGARRFRFQPATRDGSPIRAKIRYRVGFRAPSVAPEEAPVESATTAPSPAPTPAPARSADAPIEVTVSADRTAPMTTTFSRAEVREIPGAFGDPFRAIESMPGVTPIVSGLPFFYVRGAPPGNVGYFLDGVRVPYLYHVGLGPSVIHPGMVDRVDLYPGGYPARFGRFAGGIVSGEATAPRAALHGEGNLRLFDAGALVETGFAGGRGTLLVGGRYSYTAAALSLISRETLLDYRDGQIRATYDLGERDRITAFGFGAYDLLARRDPAGLAVAFGAEFYRLDLRWDHTFDQRSSARVALTLGWDQTKLGEQRNARDRMIGGRVEIRSALSDRALLRTTADLVTDAYSASRPLYVDPDSPDAARAERLFPPRTDLAAGIGVDLALAPSRGVEITPGVRVDYFRQGQVSRGAVDPRISARFSVSDRVKILHAHGLAHQAPAFVVPVPGLAPATLDNGLQQAWQTSAGVEVSLPAEIQVTMSAFHNAYFAMTDGIGTTQGALEEATTDRRSRGRAIGLEFFARRKLGRRVGGFVSYTLSRSTREIDRQTFLASFDRTHVASAALAWDLGRAFRAGARFTIYTGAPRVRRSGGLNPLPPTLEPERDPAFYRLDLRVEKRWTFGDTTWLAVVAEMLNVGLQKEEISGTAIGPVSIPSLGLEGAF
jgi:TonB family protein